MHSLKKELITSWGISTTIDVLKDKRLVLLTPAGIIIGTFVKNNDEANSETVKILNNISSQVTRDYKKENNIDSKTMLDGNDGVLSLKDVQLKSGNAIFNFSYIDIFFDQIIGVTLTDSTSN